MRTTVNFQYAKGHSTIEAFKILYKEGGIPRFYNGLLPALMQGPISRFGDTAANAGMLALWDEMEYTKELPVWAKTVSASAAAASFRYLLMPIDALKTINQVHGGSGYSKLWAKVRMNGPTVLWAGGLGAVGATFIGHYPWYDVYLFIFIILLCPRELCMYMSIELSSLLSSESCLSISLSLYLLAISSMINFSPASLHIYYNLSHFIWFITHTYDMI